MTKHEIADLVRPVDGWLFDGEARLLFELARTADPAGVIVEIGSWKGKSTICLAKGSEAGPRLKVYAIDPHIGSEEHHATGQIWTFEEFQANIRTAGVQDSVIPMVKTSTAAAKEFTMPVSLVFIDGAHDYDSVKADFEAWFPKVIEGGMVAFHDTTGWEGPRRLVRTALFRNPQIRGANFCWSLAYGQKRQRRSAIARLANLGRLLLKMVQELALSIATKPAVRTLILKVLGRAPQH
jgi:MMP 1-O-methyltransferase